MSKINLGRVGLWTADFDLQPMAKAQDAIAQVEAMGFGTVWVPEAVLREPFASTSLLLSATKKMILATGIASIHAVQHKQCRPAGKPFLKPSRIVSCWEWVSVMRQW